MILSCFLKLERVLARGDPKLALVLDEHQFWSLLTEEFLRNKDVISIFVLKHHMHSDTARLLFL